MNLRQKLLIVFSGLALLALIMAGIMFWTTFQWSASKDQLHNHYQRSLALQTVRAEVFRAFKEVADAVTDNDEDAKAEFEELLEPVEKDFARWAALADTEEEKKQVQGIRASYEKLLEDARGVFALEDAGKRREATSLMEKELEDVGFARFDELSDQAVASDVKIRERILKEIDDTKQALQLIPIVAIFGAVSLILLLRAYLSADLFAPLLRLETAMREAAGGNFRQRLAESARADELGSINAAFDHLMEALAVREEMMESSMTGEFAPLGSAVPAADQPMPGDGTGAQGAVTGATLKSTPSRLLLHNLVARLRSRVLQVKGGQPGTQPDTEQMQGLMDQIDLLSQAILRISEFGFPLDLNLARTDIVLLLHEVLLRFHDELAQRAVNYEIAIAPEVGHASVDRLKLREVLSALVRNSLAALPERGGRLGIRSSILVEEEKKLLIEIADDGHGFDKAIIDRPSMPIRTAQNLRSGVGLVLARAIIEQHGGHFVIESAPGQGTYARIALPLRE